MEQDLKEFRARSLDREETIQNIQNYLNKFKSQDITFSECSCTDEHISTSSLDIDSGLIDTFQFNLNIVYHKTR